ncbi:MAG: hypothetical protein ABIF87_09490 [Pseudomonadota bacterium]
MIENDSGISYPFIDFICQTPKKMEINLIDQIEASLLWQRILSNKIQYRFILCKETPKKDSDIEGNNSIISDLVSLYPEYIRDAEFHGGKFGADGFIEFIKPPLSSKKHFPLEVGYCKSDQILTHIFENQCFARFPYGYRYIVIFEETEYQPVEL